MKKLLLLLLCVPMIGLGQQTYVPDNNFEQRLIDLGYDNVLDDYVTTANINTVTYLDVSYLSITDLTGIEGFIDLIELDCGGNWLSTLDVSNNINLIDLDCYQNELVSLDLSNNVVLIDLECYLNDLVSLDVRNGNNSNMDFTCLHNPYLTCINVDDASWATSNWIHYIDNHHYFSNNCPSPTAIQEFSANKELLKITDILGREVNKKRNTPLFYIYNDVTVEKKIIIK